jgi:hypothetical protein
VASGSCLWVFENLPFVTEGSLKSFWGDQRALELLIMGGGVGGGRGSAALLCTPSAVLSCVPRAPVSAQLRSSTLRSFRTSHCNSFSRIIVLLSPRRSRQGRSFHLVRASKEDDTGVESDSDPSRNGEDGVDWDKAWSTFSKPQKRKSLFKLPDMEQYVSRRPTHSKYPESEEIDPMKKTERGLLGAWTSEKFTYAMAIVLLGLAVYMIIIIGPPPRH